MVNILAISILLLPMVTASGDDFWDDVDMVYNDLSDSEDLQTQEKTSEDLLVEPTRDAPPHSRSLDEKEEKARKRRGPSTAKFFPKYVTLRQAEVKNFKQIIIINRSDTQNISVTEMEDRLLKLGSFHGWSDLETYNVEKYPKYWAKVCVFFWSKPLNRRHRISCIVSRSYAKNKKQKLKIRNTKQYIDMLGCRCTTYLTNSKNPLFTPQKFLIHKGNKDEFFIFKENEFDDKISISGFKNGITLPNPAKFERSNKSSAKFLSRVVTLNPYEIEMFNHALTINDSYSKNVSMEELEKKLMELEDIHEWPVLLHYDHENYSKYWGKVCVFFWDKKLDRTHRQTCTLSPSLGDNKIRRLFLQSRTQYFDLLYCKCYSYVSNMKNPVSSADTFLIHQSSDNEFFVFEQRSTEYCHYTLFIKDFKGGITLPNPEDFN